MKRSPAACTAAMRPKPLFVYGTLLDPRIRSAVLGARRSAPARPARLPGYRRLFVHEAEYPALRRCIGAAVDGLLLPAPDARTLADLDAHEGDEYRRGIVTITQGGRLVRAETYLATPLARLARRPWRLDARWTRRRDGYYRRTFSSPR